MWVTILRTIRKPVEDVLRLRVVRCQADTLDEGLEWHEIESIKVPVYSVARTLVDLFRQRNKIGIDVAIEALREAGRGRRFQLKELNRMADKFRMTRVMKPYMNPRGSSSRFDSACSISVGNRVSSDTLRVQ